MGPPQRPRPPGLQQVRQDMPCQHQNVACNNQHFRHVAPPFLALDEALLAEVRGHGPVHVYLSSAARDPPIRPKSGLFQGSVPRNSGLKRRLEPRQKAGFCQLANAS